MMHRPTRSVVVMLLLAFTANAQQPNTPAASMTIDGVAGPPYPITGVPLTAGFEAVVDITGPVGAPFVVIMTPSLTTGGGTLVLGSQFLDVDISPGYSVLMDGLANPGTFSIGASGTFNTNYPVSTAAVTGAQAATQAVLADPTNPGTFVALSAASQVSIIAPAAVVPISTPNNGGALFDLVPYGMTFPYYASSYTRMFINTDGNITFGSASGDFTPTPTEFRTQQPRIAPQWTDLDQSYAGASIVATVSQTSPTVRVDWIEMAEWSNAGSRHSFHVLLDMTNGDIVMVHDPLNMAMVYDELMGISPGQNAIPTTGWPAQRDLSTLPSNPIVGQPNEAFWEWFGLANGTMPYYTAGFNNPWDMAGTTTRFVAVGAGALGASYVGM